MNRDGYVDVLWHSGFAANNGTGYACVGTGSNCAGAEALEGKDVPRVGSARGVAADLDNDGIEDLVIAGLSDGGSWVVRTVRVNGTGQPSPQSWFSEFAAQPSGSKSITSVVQPGLALADFNHDGWIDIVIVGRNAAPSSAVYYNPADGSGLFVLENSYTLLAAVGAGGDVVAADYDQDGDRDVLVLGELFGDKGSSKAAVMRRDSFTIDATDPLVYIRLPLTEAPMPVFDENGTNPRVRLFRADLDGDARADLLACLPGDPIKVLRNEGEGIYVPWATLAAPVSCEGDVGDVSGDAVDDVVLPFSDSGLSMVSADGGGPPVLSSVLNVAFPQTVRLVHWDNDSVLDAIVSHSTAPTANATLSCYLGSAARTDEPDPPINLRLSDAELETADFVNNVFTVLAKLEWDPVPANFSGSYNLQLEVDGKVLGGVSRGSRRAHGTNGPAPRTRIGGMRAGALACFQVQAISPARVAGNFSERHCTIVFPLVEADKLSGMASPDAVKFDWDGDGRAEAALTGFDGTAIVSMYVSTTIPPRDVDAPPSVTVVSLDAPVLTAGGGAAVLDLDSDGISEAVFVGGTFGVPKANVYRSLASASLPTFDESLTNELTPHSHFMGMTAVADLNGDGVRELIVTGTHQFKLVGKDGFKLSEPAMKVVLVRPNASPRFEAFDLTVGLLRGFALSGRLDGDEYEDVLVCGRTTSSTPLLDVAMVRIPGVHEGRCVLVRGSPDPAQWERALEPVGLPNLTDSSGVLFDADGDGTLDVIMSGATGDYSFSGGLFLNPHGNATFVKTSDTVLGLGLSSMALIDIEGDGQLEVVLMGATVSAPGDDPVARVGVYTYNRAERRLEELELALDPMYIGLLMTMDADSDGALDMAVFGVSNLLADGRFLVNLVVDQVNATLLAPPTSLRVTANTDLGRWDFDWDAPMTGTSNLYIKTASGYVVSGLNLLTDSRAASSSPLPKRLVVEPGNMHYATHFHVSFDRLAADAVFEAGLQYVAHDYRPSAFQVDTSTLPSTTGDTGDGDDDVLLNTILASVFSVAGFSVLVTLVALTCLGICVVTIVLCLFMCLIVCIVLAVLALIVCAMLMGLPSFATAGLTLYWVQRRGWDPDKYYNNHDFGHYRELELEDLVLDELIGEGAFSRVYRGQWHHAEVAIKVLERLKMKDEDLDELRREAELMEALGRHPNIVGFIGAVTTGSTFCIVTDYYPNGSLYDVLVRDSRDIPYERRMVMLRDAAAGVQHLHDMGMVHRDIAMRNCLVGSDLEVYVSDFGTSRLIDSAADDATTKSNLGPVRHMAPESIRDRVYSFKSDVYMFGMLMYEVLTSCKLPYDGLSILEVAQSVVHNELRPTLPSSVPDNVQAIVRGCWCTDPNERLTMDTILEKLNAITAPYRTSVGTRTNPSSNSFNTVLSLAVDSDVVSASGSNTDTVDSNYVIPQNIPAPSSSARNAPLKVDEYVIPDHVPMRNDQEPSSDAPIPHSEDESEDESESERN